MANATVTGEQRGAIDALDKQFLDMSGEQNADFWLDETYLASHPAWAVIRSLSRACATTFERKIEVPPCAQPERDSGLEGIVRAIALLFSDPVIGVSGANESHDAPHLTAF